MPQPQLYHHPDLGFGTSVLGNDVEEVQAEEEVVERQPSGAIRTTLRKSKATFTQQGRGHMSTSSMTETYAPQPQPSTRFATTASPGLAYQTRRHVSDGPTSNTLRRALSTASVVNRPQPTHDARLQESGGLALKPAQRAMFGRHRHVSQRFYWTLPPEHDERVEGLLNWVAVMGWGLGNLGVSEFPDFVNLFNLRAS